MATVYVNLYVNTGSVNQSNIDSTCTFNQPSGTDEDYTTDVTVGDTVIWSGSPNDNPPAGTYVNITGVVDTGGPNVFTNLTVSSTTPTTVTGTVENGMSNPNGDEETYTLYFSVVYPNGNTANFHIDPKIQVHPPPPPPMESNLEPKEKLVSE